MRESTIESGQFDNLLSKLFRRKEIRLKECTKPLPGITDYDLGNNDSRNVLSRCREEVCDRHKLFIILFQVSETFVSLAKVFFKYCFNNLSFQLLAKCNAPILVTYSFFLNVSKQCLVGKIQRTFQRNRPANSIPEESPLITSVEAFPSD